MVVPDPALGPEVPFGDSIRLRLLRRALGELGHEVSTLWSKEDHPVEAIKQRGARLPARVRPFLRDVRSVVQSRAFDRALDAAPPADLVLEFAAYLAPSGHRLAQRLQVPYVIEVEGPLANLRYESGGSPLRWAGDRVLAAQLRAAGSVLTVSEPLADHIVALGARRDRVVVAPNVADEAVFGSDEATRLRLRRELWLVDGEFVVGFHGVFSPWYALPRLIREVAASGIRDVHVLLVGDGVDRPSIEEEAARAGVRLTVTGFVSQERAAELVAAFDIGVVPDHAWWTSPLKLFELGAASKPVLAARAPSITAVADDSEVALFDATQPGALARELHLLHGSLTRRNSLARTWHVRVLADFGIHALRRNLEHAIELAAG
jgi:glycosyltransferase involved in cell wall biosynthesis